MANPRNFEPLKQLKFSEVFENPKLLVDAVRVACPTKDCVSEEDKEYGTYFGEVVTRKLDEITPEFRKLSIAEFKLFEDKLSKVGMQEMLSLLTANPIFEEFLANEEPSFGDIDALKEYGKNEGFAEQEFSATIATNLRVAIRHRVARTSSDMRKELSAMAKSEADKEKASVEEAKDPTDGMAWSPLKEALGEALDLISQHWIKDKYHHMVVDDTKFYAAAEKADAFGASPDLGHSSRS